LLAGISATANGQIVASDNASDPEYADGWFIGDNGGSGFGPWGSIGSYGPDPVMEIDVAANGVEPDNDLGAPAFRITTGGVPFAAPGGFHLRRPFLNPMQVGETFSIDFDGYPLNDGTPPGADLLISLESAGGERVALYGYYASDGATWEFGTDFMGINAMTANNNLAGGASLPPDDLNGIDWQTNYTAADSSHGFTLTVEMVTADTYRLRVVDDSVTKLDISGQMYGGATSGQGLSSVVIYGSDINYDPPINAGRTIYFDNMQILAPPGGIDGDYDDDGKVDAADYVTWRKNAGTTNTLPNDPHGGTIGALQYGTWRANFGLTAGSGSGLAGVVPEPSAEFLLLFGIVTAIPLRRPR
jgi:hypothetical protein